MKIGDEVFVHGYVDEIRSDVVIIRNEGGYFGTVPSEVNCSGIPNNCTDCECTDDCTECKEAEHGCKDEPQIIACPIQEEDADYARWLYEDEPTISKMEQVDKDTNVRSKDCTTCKHDLWHTPRICGKCVRQEDGKPSMYEPKTEPQTCENRKCKNYDTINDHCRFIEQCRYEPKTEPQTDCAWGKGEEK